MGFSFPLDDCFEVYQGWHINERSSDMGDSRAQIKATRRIRESWSYIDNLNPPATVSLSRDLDPMVYGRPEEFEGVSLAPRLGYAPTPEARRGVRGRRVV
jgi:hypothetical protein